MSNEKGETIGIHGDELINKAGYQELGVMENRAALGGAGTQGNLLCEQREALGVDSGSLGEQGALGAPLGVDLGRLGEQFGRFRGGNDGRVAYVNDEAAYGRAANVISELDRTTTIVCAREIAPGEAVLAMGVSGCAKGGLGEASLQLGEPSLALGVLLSLGELPLARGETSL
ncbi:unnamed protein product [Ilex paraguariensis]|uniref:Uncharacterized protein n=1 Tax=Ilex paraguariensis TaxID=185542 RepID=A0ABC8QTD0_9AQUA